MAQARCGAVAGARRRRRCRCPRCRELWLAVGVQCWSWQYPSADSGQSQRGIFFILSGSIHFFVCQTACDRLATSRFPFGRLGAGRDLRVASVGPNGAARLARRGSRPSVQADPGLGRGLLFPSPRNSCRAPLRPRRGSRSADGGIRDASDRAQRAPPRRCSQPGIKARPGRNQGPARTQGHTKPAARKAGGDSASTADGTEHPPSRTPSESAAVAWPRGAVENDSAARQRRPARSLGPWEVGGAREVGGANPPPATGPPRRTGVGPEVISTGPPASIRHHSTKSLPDLPSESPPSDSPTVRLRLGVGCAEHGTGRAMPDADPPLRPGPTLSARDYDQS